MNRKFLAVLSALVAVVVGLVSAGSARATATHESFTAQTRAAGYTSAQADKLQQEVDQYLDLFGGKQTAINEIRFAGGKVLLPLPGETRPHALGVQPKVTCPALTLCLWHDDYFTGPQVQLKHCWDWRNIIWTTEGSWYNNQSAGTVAKFYAGYNLTGGVWITSRAPEVRLHIGWWKLYSVDPC